MKYFILIIFCLSIIFSSCKKNINDKEDIPQIDTLKQYFKFQIGNTLYSFYENDTINIYPFRNRITTSSHGDTAVYIHESVIYINSGTSNFESYKISFYSKKDITNDMIDSNDSGCEILKGEDDFLNYFMQNNWQFLRNMCFDSIYDNNLISFSKTNYDTSWFTNTNDCFSSVSYDQSSSDFEITSTQKYHHLTIGDCILSQGKFNITLYYAPGAPWADTLNLTNGRFSLLFSECNIIYL